MEKLETIEDMRAWTAARKADGLKVGFVPTMGGLHKGHLSLVDKAREAADVVVVSIFLNPIQFDDPDDLESYPSTLEDDLLACSGAKVDAVFLPKTADIYPDGYSTFIEVVGPLTDKLCGAARPGHFRGVTTVVSKLFNIVQPDYAVFGEKDLQQVLIINRMVQDLAIPVTILVADTVRDADGIALSSRNERLSPDQRAIARSIPQGLAKAAKAFTEGTRKGMGLTEIFYNEVLVHPGVEVDYADTVKIRGFAEADDVEVGDILAVAVFIDGIRLIDHVVLGGEPIPVTVSAED